MSDENDTKSNVIQFPGTKALKKESGDQAGADSESSEPKADFRMFVQAIARGDIKSAEDTLHEIFGMNRDIAERATAHFVKKLSADANFVQEAMKLRFVIQSGTANECLMAIGQVFGLEGIEAISVFSKLQSLLK